MGLVVQKYGGSSVADAEGIKRVAPKGSSTPKKNGHEVVVVVSAMGDTTDELIDLAEQVSPIPRAREFDMLLTAGERISMALLAMAIKNLGHEAQSFTGSQAGVITDSVHNKARIIDVTPGRIRQTALDEGNIAIVAGFQGVSPGQEGHHHAGAGRLRHHRRRAGRGAGRRGLRDLHRRRRGLHRRPALVKKARKMDWIAFEDMLELAASGSKVLLHRCVEYARRYNIPIHVRSSFSGHLPTGRPARSRNEPHRTSHPRRQAGGAGDHLRRRARHAEAKITVVGVPDKPGEAARRSSGPSRTPRSTST